MNEIFVVESDGRRRPACENTCKQCGNVYRIAKRFADKSKFCSDICSRLSRRKRQIVNCTTCGEIIERAESKLKSSKHQTFYCSNRCHALAQRLDADYDIVLPSHYGTSDDYRLKSKEKLDQGCVGCPEKRLYLLMVHHVDGNRLNSDPNNLEVVCGRCHMIRHLKQNINGEWVYHPVHLTPRDVVESMQS